MMYHKIVRRFTLALAIVAVSSVVVAAKDYSTLTVSSTMSLNGSLIKPGKYRVTWVTHSPEATVTLTKGKRVIATAEGRLVPREVDYNRNGVVYRANPDGTRTLIEIRLGKKNLAIVFDQ